MRGFMVTALLLAVAAPARGDDLPHLYRSAYYLGRGDTGIAIADDQEAIFYNPAGIAAGQGIYKKTVLASPTLEVSQDTRDLARQLLVQKSSQIDTIKQHVGKPEHAALYDFNGIVMRRVAIGVFQEASTDLLFAKQRDYRGLEGLSLHTDATAGATFSLAEGFFNQALLMGVTGKYLYRGDGHFAANIADLAQSQNIDTRHLLAYGTGAGADFGLQLRGGGPYAPAFGLTVRDIGDTRIAAAQAGSSVPSLKQTINAGFALSPSTKSSRLRFLLDVNDLTGNVEPDFAQRIHMGAEISLRDMLGFTTGVGEGYASGGFYLDLYLVRLDVGGYSEETGSWAGRRPDRRFFLRLSAGF